jgi:4-hydroxy-3-methylbut-2-en-1-yl diphosphate reductase
MRILLASPHGFCAGVVMAIRALDRALELLGAPLYVYHEIVHNRHVVESFAARGVVFVDSIHEVPAGANLLFSAHGVAPLIRELARQRGIHAIDATCPLVAKVHAEAVRFAQLGYTIVLIGHEGHDEVVGTIGEAPDQILLVGSPEEVEELQIPDSGHVAYLTQTTLSVDEAAEIIQALRGRFPRIVGPAKDDICYATQNRQEAVRELLPEADLVLVVGSRNSSNSIRLKEVARAQGTPAHLVDDSGDLHSEWFDNVKTVLLTAGASAPEHLVDECIDWMRQRFGATVEERVVRREQVSFPLPQILR